jgi:membrane-associated PAP2 superfamily phosphatase
MRPGAQTESGGRMGRFQMGPFQKGRFQMGRLQPVHARFYVRHLAWPLIAFAALAIALPLFDIDRRWADALYSWQGHTWALKSSFAAATLIHTYGRLLSVAAWIVVLLIWIATLVRARMAPWRRPLGYLLLATAVAALTVAWMKSWTNMDCPWDIAGYGGIHPYHSLFAPRPTDHHGECFPAAHASAGYCWLSLYFFFMATRAHLRWFGLGLALGIGLLFGVTQQLRGAHFLSHDLWSLAVCWASALALYVVMLKGRPVMPDSRAGDQVPRHPPPRPG